MNLLVLRERILVNPPLQDMALYYNGSTRLDIIIKLTMNLFDSGLRACEVHSRYLPTFLKKKGCSILPKPARE